MQWKEHERNVARYFGATRTPLSGGNSKQTRADAIHESLFVECKYGRKVAPWTLFLETEKLAKAEGKIPVLALKETGKAGFLIVCRDNDLLDVSDVRLRLLIEDDEVDLDL